MEGSERKKGTVETVPFWFWVTHCARAAGTDSLQNRSNEPSAIRMRNDYCRTLHELSTDELDDHTAVGLGANGVGGDAVDILQ